MMARRFASRLLSTSSLKRGGLNDGGIPGENLPFDISNRYKLTLMFTIFLGSGMALPFAVVHHQLTNNEYRAGSVTVYVDDQLACSRLNGTRIITADCVRLQIN